MNTVTYALVDYDVHKNQAMYAVIYQNLGPVALFFTESVYLVNLAQSSRVYDAFNRINTALRAKGQAEITFNVTEISETMTAAVRERSVKALTMQVQEIAARLTHSIQNAEDRFDVLTDNVENLAAKIRNRIALAGRELKTAKGLALLFSIQPNVQTAVEVTEHVVAAHRAVRLVAVTQ